MLAEIVQREIFSKLRNQDPWGVMCQVHPGRASETGSNSVAPVAHNYKLSPHPGTLGSREAN